MIIFLVVNWCRCLGLPRWEEPLIGLLGQLGKVFWHLYIVQSIKSLDSKSSIPCSLIETEKWAVTVLKIQTFLQLFKILILYKIFPPLCPLWQPAACCLSYKWTLIKSTAIFSGQHQPTAPVQKLPASILILTIMICHLRICFETRSWPISCDQHTKSTGASILIILSRDTLIIRSAALGQEWRQADGAFEIQKCQRFLCHNLPRLGHCCTL